MQKDYIKDEGGFVLVDICVAAFLCLAVVAMLAGYSLIAQIQRNSEAELTALFLAKEQFARIENRGTAFIASQDACSWLGNSDNNIQKNNFVFQVDTRITACYSASNMRRIVVNVSWKDDKLTGERSFERIIYAP